VANVLAGIERRTPWRVTSGRGPPCEILIHRRRPKLSSLTKKILFRRSLIQGPFSCPPDRCCSASANDESTTERWYLPAQRSGALPATAPPGRASTHRLQLPNHLRRHSPSRHTRRCRGGGRRRTVTSEMCGPCRRRVSQEGHSRRGPTCSDARCTRDRVTGVMPLCHSPDWMV
jgi:hypothetical protein